MIKDEFSDLPISRQRKYQLRKLKNGKCQICGKQLSRFSATRCDKHHEYSRVHTRLKMGYKPWVEGGVGRPPTCKKEI